MKKFIIFLLILSVIGAVVYFFVKGKNSATKRSSETSYFDAESCPIEFWKATALQRKGVKLPSDFVSEYGSKPCELMSWAYELDQQGYSGENIWKEADYQRAISKGIVKEDNRSGMDKAGDWWESVFN